MKGFILTVDAIIALGLSLAVLGLALPLARINNPSSIGEAQLYRYSADVLAVLQKSGAVQSALAGDSSALSIAMAAYTSPGKCLQFTATRYPGGGIAAALAKPGCNSPGSGAVSAVSSEYYDGNLYEIELVGWNQ